MGERIIKHKVLNIMKNYYSENWYEATDKFFKYAIKNGSVNWCACPKTKYDIPYVCIGKGDKKIVINSGIHGIEGYFGSAAQNLFLDKVAPALTSKILDNYTIILIHVVNGWGMQHRMREVRDFSNGGLVDLNRNFGIDFNNPQNLPENLKYAQAHELLLSKPDKYKKTEALKAFRKMHLKDGGWDAISYGQYYEPYGLFYGGCEPMLENRMVVSVYDNIVKDAKSLLSIGLHTGLGRFYRKAGMTTAQMLVSHPSWHRNTRFFNDIFGRDIKVVPDESAITGPNIQGDLVDCLENRYQILKIPVYTADFEIGTGEFPIMSPIYKRMDMGDARYELLHDGKIGNETWSNLTESWYPTDKKWRESALLNAHKMFSALLKFLDKEK